MQRTNKVHLDIKPDNIMVEIRNETAVYIVIDFGLASEASNSRTGGGTANYKYTYTASLINDIYATVVIIMRIASMYNAPYFQRNNGTKQMFDECFVQKSNHGKQMPILTEDFRPW